jgi:hypothetical protein
MIAQKPRIIGNIVRFGRQYSALQLGAQTGSMIELSDVGHVAATIDR